MHSCIMNWFLEKSAAVREKTSWLATSTLQWLLDQTRNQLILRPSSYASTPNLWLKITFISTMEWLLLEYGFSFVAAVFLKKQDDHMYRIIQSRKWRQIIQENRWKLNGKMSKIQLNNISKGQKSDHHLGEVAISLRKVCMYNSVTVILSISWSLGQSRFT